MKLPRQFFKALAIGAPAPYRELPRDAQENIRAEVRRRLGAFASGGRFLMEVDMLFAVGRR